MTTGKGFVLAGTFVGAFALGALIGPQLSHRGAAATDGMAANQAPQASVDSHASPPANESTVSSRRDSTRTRTAAVHRTPSAATRRSVPAAAPALQDVLKPVLNKGADMSIASEDFVDGEQFAMVAHAARNTTVPFMVLKNRVVDQRKSLEDAIRELKPNLNAVAEASRARAEAKTDIRGLLG